MSGILARNQGVYNNAARYKVTNITREVFVTYWGKNPVTLQPGQTVSVPQYLANKMVDEMVDKIMIDGVKQAEVDYYQRNPNAEINRFRAPSSLGVPAARKVWEDKILEELPIEEGSTEAQLLRLQIKEELEHDIKAEPSTEPVKVPVSAVGSFDGLPTEFAEIASQTPKKPLGRPKKVATTQTPTE